MYIDKTYYDSIYTNTLSTTEFNLLADASSDIINDLCYNRINSFGFEEFSASTQIAIKKATAAQVNLIDSEGGVDALNGNSGSANISVSIGKYSEQKSANKTFITIDGVPISPAIKRCLKYTNLMYAVPGCYDISFFN